MGVIWCVRHSFGMYDLFKHRDKKWWTGLYSAMAVHFQTLEGIPSTPEALEESIEDRAS